MLIIPLGQGAGDVELSLAMLNTQNNPGSLKRGNSYFDVTDVNVGTISFIWIASNTVLYQAMQCWYHCIYKHQPQFLFTRHNQSLDQLTVG